MIYGRLRKIFHRKLSAKQTFHTECNVTECNNTTFVILFSFSINGSAPVANQLVRCVVTRFSTKHFCVVFCRFMVLIKCLANFNDNRFNDNLNKDIVISFSLFRGFFCFSYKNYMFEFDCTKVYIIIFRADGLFCCGKNI